MASTYLKHDSCAMNPDTNDQDFIIVFSVSDGVTTSKCTSRETLIYSEDIAEESITLIRDFPEIQLFQEYKSNGELFYRPVKGTLADYIADLISTSEIATSPKDLRRKEKLLGKGSFGTVVQQGDSRVAVKKAINVEKMPELIAESNIPTYIRDECCVANILDIVNNKNLINVHMRVALGDLFTYALEMDAARDDIERWLIQIAKGLYSAHSKGFYHRDLKPENVLVFDNNGDIDAEIGDWGFAGFLPYSSHTILGGTPDYLPVETLSSSQSVGKNWFESRRGGPEVDIFSLGVIMFIVFTRMSPAYLQPPTISFNLDKLNLKRSDITKNSIVNIYGDMSQNEIYQLIKGTLYKPVILTSPEVPYMGLVRRMLDLRDRPTISEVLKELGEDYPEITPEGILKGRIQKINGYDYVWERLSKYFAEQCHSIQQFLVCIYYMNSYIHLGLINADDEKEFNDAAISSIIYSSILTKLPNYHIFYNKDMFYAGHEIPMFVSLPFTFFKDLTDRNLLEMLVAFEMYTYKNVNTYNLARAISAKTGAKIFEIPDYEKLQDYDLSVIEVNNECRQIIDLLLLK